MLALVKAEEKSDMEALNPSHDSRSRAASRMRQARVDTSCEKMNKHTNQQNVQSPPLRIDSVFRSGNLSNTIVAETARDGGGGAVARMLAETAPLFNTLLTSG